MNIHMSLYMFGRVFDQGFCFSRYTIGSLREYLTFSIFISWFVSLSLPLCFVIFISLQLYENQSLKLLFGLFIYLCFSLFL